MSDRMNRRVLIGLAGASWLLLVGLMWRIGRLMAPLELVYRCAYRHGRESRLRLVR